MAKTATKLASPKAIAAKDEPGKAKVVATATAKYVRDQPDTRVPAVLMLLLWPLGLVPYLAGWSPWLLGLFVPVAVAPTWLALHRSYGDCWYTRILTLTAGLVPVWLAVAAHVGVFGGGRVLLGYCVGAVGLWGAYVQCEVMSERKARRKAQIDWAEFAPKVGLEGSGLRETRDTRLGQEYKIDVLGTGQRTSQLVTPALGEIWAMHRSLSSQARVIVRPDPKNSRQIVVEERTLDPWKEPNSHPTLDPESEFTLPASRSVCDGPFEVGVDPSSGRLLSLLLWTPEGAQHAMFVASPGGGKTVLGSNLTERVTACVDALVWLIDTESGALPAMWRDAADWSAGVGEVAVAMNMLRAAKKVIQQRAAAAPGRNHRPRPDAPFIQIIIDEAARLLNHPNHRIASEARTLVGDIFEGGRKAAVSIVFVSQRGALQHAGTMSVKGSAGVRVCGRVTQTSEMSHILPDWQETGAPDMSKYGEGYAGVIAIQAGGGRWEAGRAWNMSDAAAVEALARQRGAPTATLEPAIAASLGESYANRRGVLVAASGVGLAVPDVGWATVEDDIDRELRAMVHESVEATRQATDALAAMQVPKGQEVPLAELQRLRAEQEADSKQARVPDEILAPMLLMFNDPKIRAEGMARSDLVEVFSTLGVSESKLKRWLRVMVDQGTLARRGNTSNAVYVLPEPSGE